jgi:inosose dehydratase
MKYQVSRRKFMNGLGAFALAAVTAGREGHALAEPLLYPPIDLSYFDTPISDAPAEIRIGYAAITWGDNELQAIEDISALGFRGIQLRANAIKDFQPGQLRDILEKHRLIMVALSSGNVHIDTAQKAADIALHTANARFLHDAGGLYLQLVDQEPKSQQITAADYKYLGSVLTEIGKRTADLGIVLGYHNHMNSLGERPEGLARLLDAADPRYVKFELDIAHCVEGGGDPVKAIEQYRDRLLFLHIKDVEDLEPGPGSSKPNQRFVELGRGKVDIPGVFKTLRAINFRGWAIVELDRVPDNSRTPKDSAIISKKYLEEKLGVTL